jgi:hypothetical protein
VKRRIAAAALAFPLLPTFAVGLGASDYGALDGMKVDPDSGAVTLLLVVDRPLEDGLTKPKVRSKMAAYRQWVAVGLPRKFPNAHPELGVRLVILHPAVKNSLGASVLEQLIGYAKELRFEPIAQLLPHGK